MIAIIIFDRQQKAKMLGNLSFGELTVLNCKGCNFLLYIKFL